MTTAPSKIGLGGGCHWCTEGVFTSLIGITKVNQGWIESNGEHSSLSEAIEVYFDPAVISLSDLIEIHLHTHASTSNHSMRGKYRSAIYTFDDVQFKQAQDILHLLSADFNKSVITQVYPFKHFKQNKIELSDYYYSAPDRPFCQTYIRPKISLLLARFNRHVNQDKVFNLTNLNSMYGLHHSSPATVVSTKTKGVHTKSAYNNFSLFSQERDSSLPYR